MPLLNALKRLSLATGLYGPARWLSRQLRPARRQVFLASVDLYRALLPAGALCFDVGANIGEKSEALLRAGAARVVSFEPNPRVLPELRARCRRRQGWEVVEAAVGSAESVATLFAREYHGQSSLSEHWPGTTIASYRVPVTTLDAAIHRFGCPAYCKIDVEGWELEVLKGLSQPLDLVSFEFHLNEQNLARAVACLERLRQLGTYRVNITPAESSALHFEQWIPMDRFLEWFPGDLDQTLPGAPYGDIFVDGRFEGRRT